VYWDRGITYRRSSKTKDKLQAISFAKVMYEEILISKYQNKHHINAYPNINKATTRKLTLTFARVADAWIKCKTPKWSMYHTTEVRRRLTHNLYPNLGNQPIHKITKQELLHAIQEIEKRGACNVARRVLNDCKQVWQYAMVIDACKYDITNGLHMVLQQHVAKHQTTIPIAELPQLMKDINSYDRDGELIVRYALQMMAHTFVRKNELLLATWKEFDLESCLWKIPAERMKMRTEHHVPLTIQTIDILKRIKQIFPSNHYVFNDGNEDVVINHNKLLNALYKLGYKHKMCVHGFRALASTILNEHGFNADVIERQLAHVDGNQVRRAYNHAQYMSERIRMMQWWSNYVVNMNSIKTY
jgi:integrase